MPNCPQGSTVGVTFKIVPDSKRNSATQPAPKAAADRVLASRQTYRLAPLLRREVLSLLHEKPRFVILDCQRVMHMDGAAVATLLECAMAARREGVRLLLARPSKAMCDTFALYNLIHVVREMAYEPPTEEIEEGGLLIIIEDDFEESIRLPAVRLAG